MSDSSNIPLAWWSPRWRAVLLAGSVATASIGCGGEAHSDAFSDAGGSGGSGGAGGGSTRGSGGTTTDGVSSTGGPGGSGGTSGGGGSGGVSNSAASVTNGGPTTTSSATTAGGNGGSGGGTPERCSQPIVSGDCEAAIPAFGYNTETGACEAFTYGGCGGNDNRFETLDECMAACDPGGRQACEHSTECVLDHECCGFCGITDPADLVAVNAKYASYQAPQCALVDCAYCPPPPELAPFGARCNAGTCEVYDVQESPLSECKVDDDCQLRNGLSCCQGCGGEQWVAVSANSDLVEKELCGGEPTPCPACAPVMPANITAICGPKGHCVVATID